MGSGIEFCSGSWLNKDGGLAICSSSFGFGDDCDDDEQCNDELPLSERQHQERAESAARQRAEFDATRNMIMFASAAIMGLITFFIARAFF